jgi:hypothetical protein
MDTPGLKRAAGSVSQTSDLLQMLGACAAANRISNTASIMPLTTPSHLLLLCPGCRLAQRAALHQLWVPARCASASAGPWQQAWTGGSSSHWHTYSSTWQQQQQDGVHNAAHGLPQQLQQQLQLVSG